MILIFSVKESGAFQGFARINGVSDKNGPKIAWVLPSSISAKALSGVFNLDWISRCVAVMRCCLQRFALLTPAHRPPKTYLLSHCVICF